MKASVLRASDSDSTNGRVQELERWDSDGVAASINRHRMVIARHRLAHPNRAILLFVHGLGGHPVATWQRFPELVFHSNEVANFDVALFRYSSGLFTNVLPGTSKLDIRGKSLDLANDIRSLIDDEHYESIIILAHSMGGILAKFAIRQLLELDAANARRISGLYMCGTPQYGSTRAIFPLRYFSPDLRLLESFSTDLSDLQLFWNSRMTSDPLNVAGNRIYLDERAIVGTKDWLVKRGSGVGALPYDRIETVGLHHTELVKPKDSQDPVFRWLLTSIEKSQQFRQPRVLERIGAPAPRGEFSEPIQVALYLKAYFESTYLVEGGRRGGHRAGDAFVVIHEGEMVSDRRGRPVYAIRSHKNYLVANRVEEHATVCQLESILYRDLPDPLDAVPQPGDEVELISNETWKLYKSLGRLDKDAKDTVGTEQRQDAFVRLLISIENFLSDYPDSYLAKDALHMKGRTQLVLSRYDEATRTFETYLEHYPQRRDLTSKNTVESLIEEARLRKILAGSTGNRIEAQVNLAKHLLERSSGEKEALSLLNSAVEADAVAVSSHLQADERKYLAALLAVHAAGLGTEQAQKLFAIEDGKNFRAQVAEFIGAHELSATAKDFLRGRLEALIGSLPPTVNAASEDHAVAESTTASFGQTKRD